MTSICGRPLFRPAKSINKDPSYSLAKNHTTHNKFRAFVNTIENAMTADRFNQSFVGNNIGNLRKDYGPDIGNHLATFVKSEEPLTNLQNRQAKCQAPHAASLGD